MMQLPERDISSHGLLYCAIPASGNNIIHRRPRRRPRELHTLYLSLLSSGTWPRQRRYGRGLMHTDKDGKALYEYVWIRASSHE